MMHLIIQIILNNHTHIALTSTETYRKPCKTSKIEHFGKIVQVFQASNTFVKALILNVLHGSE